VRTVVRRDGGERFVIIMSNRCQRCAVAPSVHLIHLRLYNGCTNSRVLTYILGGIYYRGKEFIEGRGSTLEGVEFITVEKSL
jgi:hypothetical protein